MKPRIIIAVILVAISCGHLAALGVVAFASHDISYTTREKHGIGPFEVTTNQTKHILLPPILGAVALVGGIVLLVVKTKKAEPTGCSV